MSKKHNPKPDFIIVGAPKSGTTAMCQYLIRHPDIFIPKLKEPYFFGADLRGWRYTNDLQTYTALFENGGEALCGEGSTWYLYSKKAAQEIYHHNPATKIIIMIRNPVDFIYSLHNQVVYFGDETIEDFAQALAAESERKQGKNIPKNCSQPQSLLYTETAKFTEQIQRYLDVFPKNQVYIIIFDEFKQNIADVYRKTLMFLEVDPDFQTTFEVVNPSKYARTHLLRPTLSFLQKHFAPLFRILVPQRIRHKVIGALYRANTHYRHRPPINPILYKQLQEHFSSEVQKLSDLLERDLTYWNKTQ